MTEQEELTNLFERTGLTGVAIPPRIKKHVARILDHYDATFADVRANHRCMQRNRNAGLKAKRWLCWSLRNELGLSYGQIEALLHIDHSTAIYHTKKVDEIRAKACA